MKKWRQFFTSVLTAGLLLSLSCVSVSAEPEEEYSYTVRFFAGNQGTFVGAPTVKSNADYSISTDKDDRGRISIITIDGLKENDEVSFDVQDGAVSMDASSKYYIKGIRVSGRDNNKLEKTRFNVIEDRDYVVAYGIKGNQVGYTVKYQDAAGNELAPSRTYYGNAGDKPVVAYLYIEGYDPQALALTKTLSSNENENVFTFTYDKTKQEVITLPGDTVTTIVTETVEGNGGTGNGTGAGAGNGAGTVTGNAAGTGTGAGNGAGTGTGTGNAAGTGTGNGTGTEAGAGNAAGNGAGTGAGNGAGTENGAAGGDNTTEIQPEDVPQGNQDIKDLDEEETPLGSGKIDRDKVKKGLPFAAEIAIIVAAAAALTGLAVFAVKHRR